MDWYELFMELVTRHFHGKKISAKHIADFKKDAKAYEFSAEELGECFYGLLTGLKFNPEYHIKIADECLLKLYTDFFEEMFADEINEQTGLTTKEHVVSLLCGPFFGTLTGHEKIAKNDEPILITGETGTGKEIQARILHYLSHRNRHDFLAVNCTGIPETLMESQFFGHEKGAFTGAVGRSVGIFESVGQGTLFLDEIGDMPLSIQAKLLRVLQTKEFYRVGNYKEKLSFEGRIIAATNKSLVNNPSFRSDLFYRLDVFRIWLMPLRIFLNGSRDKEAHFRTIVTIILRNTSRKYPRPTCQIQEEALVKLRKYNYPGNFRELTNVITAAYLESDGDIRIKHLPYRIQSFDPDMTNKIASAESKRPDYMDFGDIKLRDIISVADKVKASIVRKKIEQVKLSGLTIKKALALEGIASNSKYQSFRNQLEKICGGKGSLKRIKQDFPTG